MTSKKIFCALIAWRTATAFDQCNTSPRTPPAGRAHYRVGVLANRGIETAFDEFNTTFSSYLTEAVGKRHFEPALSFETIPVEFGDALEDFQSSTIDFLFANPSVFSCVESESGASSLATFVSMRRVAGVDHVLDEFGGVVIARADNEAVQSISDLKDKVVASVSLTGLGSGLMQFREMRKAGLHHLQDPKQLIFMKKQGAVVNAVLNGQIDVGFIRTDQLERSIDKTTGESLDLSKVKIINPALGATMSDGSPFPFTPSTQLYPEWNFAARKHVDEFIVRKVQEALYNMRDYAHSPEVLDDCTVPSRSTARIAGFALSDGGYWGWRPTLSYIQLRVMQEELGVVRGSKCVDSADIEDAVDCPEGFFKKRRSEIINGCAAEKLDCFGFQCICSPCEKSNEVNFAPLGLDSVPCSKFEICGEVEQGQLIVFEAVDNTRREELSMSVRVINGKETETFPMHRVNQSNQFLFTFDANQKEVGTPILEVYAGEDQLLESPFRLEIVERDCEDTGEARLEPDLYGNCVCSGYNVPIGEKCAPTATILGGVGLFVSLIIAFLVKRYVKRKSEEASYWKITPEQLVFADAPRCLGRGAFGIVLEASYRGSLVAVKRVFQLKAGSQKRSDSISPFTEFDSSDPPVWPNLSKQRSDKQSLKLFCNEMKIVSRLRHPCIVTVIGAVIEKGSEPMLVMESMEMDLHDLLHNETMVLDGETILPILQDISRGVRYLHASGVLHKDLKSTNILLDIKLRAKLADFGLSRYYSASDSTVVGTPTHMAPELLRRDSTNTTFSDVYAFGAVMTEIFSRKRPYEGEDDITSILREVADPLINKRPTIPKNCPPQITKLIEACFDSDPPRRPTAETIDLQLKLLESELIEDTSPTKGNLQDLLYQVFPPHVADTLRQGKKPEPERYDCVTVFFSDIISYTEISSRLDPRKVSDLLDRLYTKFDNLCSIYNVFKVETIGDAYMAVTNLADKQENHAEVAARFALAAVKAAAATCVDPSNPAEGFLQIRAGFHSGPVVAQVVGSRTPRYSVIGDTVNVAARMESNSLPGMVHCSLASADLLKHSNPNGIRLINRGRISVKGKGKMETFFVQNENCVDGIDEISIPEYGYCIGIFRATIKRTWGHAANGRDHSANLRAKFLDCRVTLGRFLLYYKDRTFDNSARCESAVSLARKVIHRRRWESCQT